MEIYKKLAEVRDMVSLRKHPDAWANRAEVLAQIAAQCFLNEDEPDEIPRGLYINNCELTFMELEKLFTQLGIPASKMKMELTSCLPGSSQIFVEIFML